MKESFSRAVTAFVSCHLEPRRFTESLIRFLYLSNCSSGGGRRLRHSSTTLSFALDVDDLIFSRCRRTLSVCADSLVCHFSRREGSARLSKRSNTVRVSNGGSHSSWQELKSEVDAFLDSKFGLGMGEASSGVFEPMSGEPSFADEVHDP